jgi:hypothetical protein
VTLVRWRAAQLGHVILNVRPIKRGTQRLIELTESLGRLSDQPLPVGVGVDIAQSGTIFRIPDLDVPPPPLAWERPSKASAPE